MSFAGNDIIGKRYSKLIVIEFSHKGKYGKYWKCKCDCGKEKITHTAALNSKRIQSCGCLRSEKVKERAIKRNTKHGLYQEFKAEHGVWLCILQRCNDPTFKQYNDYGGRGIFVCERWKWFPNFLEDMGKRPHPKLTIDRIDNDDGYYKENCRWTTRKVNNNNKRNSKNNRR